MNKVLIHHTLYILIKYILLVVVQCKYASLLTYGFSTGGIPTRLYRGATTRSIRHYGILYSTTTTTTTSENEWNNDFCPTNDNNNGNNNNDSIKTVHGPFHSEQIQDCWGKRPLLIRNAFPPQIHKYAWPSWDDIINLSCGEDHTSFSSPSFENDERDNSFFQIESGESARFVQHVPGELDTFTLDVGPFDRRQLQRQMSTTTSSTRSKHRKKQPKVWTLLLNDVERYCPALDTWMMEHFHFLPRWRRDDAQISCTSTISGSIGPHVDNYDVCLIQISGQRIWRILLVSPTEETMSYRLEQQLLIPNIPVSVLNLTTATATAASGLQQSQWVEFLLEEGDMLYLPPRFVHWGLGQSTDCMTLSVGARAPSASDLLMRITEHVQQVRQPLSSLQRYTDDASLLDFLSKDSVRIGPEMQNMQPSISTSVKESMKTLVRNMMDDVLNDESMWDMIVGKLITDPLRYSDSFPIPFSDDFYSHKNQSMIWDNASPLDILQSVQQLGHKASLRKVAGISSATSQVRLPPTTSSCNGSSNNRFLDTNSTIIDRLFAHGEMYEVVSICDNSNEDGPTMASIVFQRIDDSLPVYGTMLRDSNNDGINPMLIQILQELMENGIVRPCHETNI